MGKVKKICYAAIFEVGGSLDLINHYLDELYSVDSNDTDINKVVSACTLLLQHKKSYFEDKKEIGNFTEIQREAISSYCKLK